MNNNWIQSSNTFFLREVSQQTNKLPIGVYKVELDPKTLQLFLTQVSDKFSFPYKVYGVETKFIDRVVKTYNNTTGNLGILMNGVKGTGKTVTSQMICNELKMPVLIVHEPYDGLSSFINEIQQDIIVFFDEFEKMYKKADTVLTIMDGVLNNEHRKVFVLTTNNTYINENMLQRPGRLRYLKTFEDLTVDVITEIVDDKLIHKTLRDKCISFIAKLDMITIDIVKAVIDEVNIHEEDPEEFKDVFNIQTITNQVNLYINDPAFSSLTKLEYSNALIEPVKFSNENIEDYLYINGDDVGAIKQILNEDTIIVEMFKKDKEGNRIIQTFRIERLDTKHKSFSKWVF